jgi:uncharacterized protein
MMEPRNQISTKALKVWRISGLLISLIFWGITLTIIILTQVFDWPYWISLVTSGVSLVVTYLSVYLLPSLRWKRWRYEVRDTEVEIQSGIFIIKRTLIPMVRVQHVETNQGPLLRKYQLASVEISTAATTHEIPALELSEADDLRFYISKMASVEEEDV